MRKSKIRITALFVLMTLILSVFPACGSSGSKKIGVSMPSKTETRWAQDSDNIMRQLQAKGYEVDMRNAGGDVNTQIDQIQSMIDGGCAVLLIAAIDGSKLTDALQKAAAKHVKVIAYDRLIRDTPNVDYYATFDNFEVGVIQGGFLEDALNLKNGGGPYNIEIFAGDPADNNSQFFYDGAMSVLRPYLDSGELVALSGQTEFDDVSTPGWDATAAQDRMTELLNDYYADGAKLDAVLSPNDGLDLNFSADGEQIGIITALKNAGYGGDGKPFPLLTGQDGVKENVVAILDGEQSMTVFKDTRMLAERTVTMIDDIMVKKKTEVNDTKTYDNGVKIVPAYVCAPLLVDKDNYKNVLIDSGYYKQSDLTN